MTRLPTPGGDDNLWGGVLNDFLQVEHNSDGTLKKAADIAAKYVKPADGIPESDLDANVQIKLNASGGGTLGGDLSGTVSSAQIVASAVGNTELGAGAVTDVKVAAGAAIALSKLATDPLTRTNHTGTQLASTISDFAETARDTLATALVAGSNVTITPNDGADTITIAATTGSVRDVSVKDTPYNAVGNGVADDTAAIQAAITAAAGNEGIYFPPGTYRVTSTITLPGTAKIRGAGDATTTITSTHAGAVFTTDDTGVRKHLWRISDIALEGPGAGTVGSCAVDVDSISSAHFSDMSVNDYEKGFRIRSVVSGGSVFNRFTNVTASLCDIGFSLEADGSNATTFDRCRVNICTSRGFSIVDSNNCNISDSQIEGCGVGVYVEATSAALSDASIVSGSRFEGNTIAWRVNSPNVRDFTVANPSIFDTYTVVDNGTRTQHYGQASYGPQKWSSAVQDASGGWRFERVINGGSETPAMVVRDDATTSGTPVTHQVETERSTGYFYRANRGGVTYWDVDAADGNMRMPLGGYIELNERASDPAAPATNQARLYIKDNGSGKSQLCIRFATGVVQVISTEP